MIDNRKKEDNKNMEETISKLEDAAKETIGCLFLSRELRHNMCICRQLFDRRNRDHSVAGGPAHISGGERNFRPGCFRKGRPCGIYAIGRMRIVIY